MYTAHLLTIFLTAVTPKISKKKESHYEIPFLDMNKISDLIKRLVFGIHRRTCR